jgi:transcriptional regulator with XRE-family HTH domain
MQAVMPRRYVHEPITDRELSRLLKEAGMTAHQLARATGSDQRRVERWLSGEQPDPPLWTASFLVAMSVPEARERVLDFLSARVVDTRRDS